MTTILTATGNDRIILFERNPNNEIGLSYAKIIKSLDNDYVIENIDMSDDWIQVYLDRRFKFEEKNEVLILEQ